MIKQFLNWFRYGYMKTPVKHKPHVPYTWHEGVTVGVNEKADFKFTVIEEPPTYQLNDLIKQITPENLPDPHEGKEPDPVEEFVKEVEQKPKRKKSGTKRAKRPVQKRRTSRSAKPRTRSPKR